MEWRFKTDVYTACIFGSECKSYGIMGSERPVFGLRIILNGLGIPGFTVGGT